MTVLDRVLGLRPTNAVARLGEASRLPLLNPRDLVRALEKFPATLLTVPVTTTTLFAPLLRAAREQDSVVGFSVSSLPTDRDRAERLVDGLQAASEEVAHRRPVFVQGGPIRPRDATERTIGQAVAEVFRSLDAGATLVAVDPSNLPAEAIVDAVVRLAEPAIERELALELALPASLDLDGHRALLARLNALEVRPLFLRARSDRLLLDAVGRDEQVVNFELLEALKQLASEFEASLSLEDRGTPLRLLPSWTAAGVRKVELTATFARIALPFCLELGLSLDSDVPLSEATAKACGALDSLEGEARDRLEALVFAEALDVLADLGGEHSATRAMRFLAEHGAAP